MKLLPSPTSWIELSKISKIFDCKHYTPTYVPEGIPLIRTNDLTPGFFRFGNTVYVSEDAYRKLTDVHKPQKGDIVFAREGSFGVASYIHDDRKFAIGQRTMIIRTDPSKVDPVYLTTFINSPLCQEKLLQISMGTTVKRVNVTDVKSLLIAIPPIAEQKRIATIAQKADRLRRTRRYTLELSDSYLRSVFLEMFGDLATNSMNFEKVTIAEISTKVTDGEHTTPKRVSSGIKLLSARNIQNGFIDFNTGLDFIPDSEYERIKKRCNPEPDDILMSCSGSIGRVTTVLINEPFSLVRSVALIKPKHSMVNSRYLEHFLRTDYCQEKINRSAHQSSQANIFTGQINELVVLLPPLPLQEKFAQIVQRFERLRIQQREAERQAEHLFQTILHCAFRGEL